MDHLLSRSETHPEDLVVSSLKKDDPPVGSITNVKVWTATFPATF